MDFYWFYRSAPCGRVYTGQNPLCSLGHHWGCLADWLPHSPSKDSRLEEHRQGGHDLGLGPLLCPVTGWEWLGEKCGFHANAVKNPQRIGVRPGRCSRWGLTANYSPQGRFS